MFSWDNSYFVCFFRASPDNAELATTLGLLYLKAQDNQRALENFGSALARDPLNARALIAAGAMMQVTHKRSHFLPPMSLANFKPRIPIEMVSGAKKIFSYYEDIFSLRQECFSLP